MKGIAIILVGCLLFMSSEYLWANFQRTAEAAPMECCSDCFSDCCTEEDHQDGQEPCQKGPDEDHQIQGGATVFAGQDNYAHMSGLPCG